jgi:hypothetical protein
MVNARGIMAICNNIDRKIVEIGNGEHEIYKACVLRYAY